MSIEHVQYKTQVCMHAQYITTHLMICVQRHGRLIPAKESSGVLTPELGKVKDLHSASARETVHFV